MNASLIAAAVLSLTAALPAQARCKHEQMPTVLEPIVVTPNGAYSIAEYEARAAQRKHLEETKVVLAPVVVTPNDEFAEAEAPTQTAQVAQHEATHAHSMTHATASASPGSPMRPTLINYLRRLFF